MLVLYELARGLTGRLELSDAADIISKHLRRIVPASTCVFFVYRSIAISFLLGTPQETTHLISWVFRLRVERD